MFEKNKELYCESCSKLNNKDYELITDHIREKPGASVMEIITATGASLKSINCFIEDGDFSYVEAANGRMIDIPEPIETRADQFHLRR